jgi:hypothetical protein
MRRDGYIVVPSVHRLFPHAVARVIEARAQKVIAAVEHRQSLALTPLAFDIHQQPKAGRSSARYVRALFEGNRNSHVRVLVADEQITAATLHKSFQGTDLLVTIEDVGLASSRLLKGLIGPSSGNIEVTSAKVERAIEDIIIDIALGTYFRERPPVSDIVAEVGLAGLYRYKAKFFRKWRARSWLSQVQGDATYAMLSSLNSLPDGDVAGRAASAYDTWFEFTESLTAARLIPTYAVTGTPTLSIGQPAGTGSAVDPIATSLLQLPKLGGQLPIRRIAAVTAKLPAGDHSLIVLLKSSSARKSPSLRGQLTALFGVRARRNSFRVLSNERLLVAGDIIDALSRSGHILVVKLSLRSGHESED